MYFEQFIELYPKQGYRPEVARQWAAIPVEERPAVLESVKRWKRSEQWHKAGGRYIPKPEYFLRDKRYRQTPPVSRSRILATHVPSYNSDAYCRKAQGPIIYHKRGA